MSDITRLQSPGRVAYRQEQEKVFPTDPKVISFMEGYAALERAYNEAVQLNDRTAVDLNVLSHRVEYLEAELARIKLKRDAFQQGYLSMKVQVSLVATAAIAALEESKREMLRENIDPEEGTTSEASERVETAVKELAKKLAPEPYEAPA
jgi:hypothetical protein